jgi:hypothetical protein
MASLLRAGPLLFLLASGCAANGEPAPAKAGNPDCSFRSPTTCWTMSGRFSPQREPVTEPPKERPPEEPPLLASDD